MRNSITALFKNHWFRFLSLAWIAGVLLRVLYVQDMEYKEDEQYNFTQAYTIAQGSTPWPWVGIASGVYLVNPGMSIWVFAALMKLFCIHTPTALATALQLFSLLGISLIFPLVFRFLKKEERTPWLWAMAFALVNPFAIVYQRKLWPEGFLPFFTMITLMGWWKRDRKWGAFTWGIIGACLGQIHMSGFFFAFGIFIWTLLFGNRLPVRKPVRWRYWFLGSVLGSLPLLPWLHYLLTHPAGGPIASGWNEICQLKFWMFWVSHPLGLHLGNILGIQFGNSQLEQLKEFFLYPWVAGQPTYLMGLVHAVALVTGVFTIGLGSVIFIRELFKKSSSSATQKNLFIGCKNETFFVQNSAFIAFGILMTVTGIAIRRYYLEIAFPLEFIWLFRMVQLASGRSPRRTSQLLGILWVCQLLISATFVGFIHSNHGSPHGDYGTAYSSQTHD